MKKLKDLREALNNSLYGRAYNEAESIDRAALPIASLVIGAGIGFITYQTISNIDCMVEGIRLFNENSRYIVP